MYRLPLYARAARAPGAAALGVAATLSVLLVAGLACHSPTGGTAVAQVTVAPTTLTLTVGQEVPLRASVLDAEGRALLGRSIFWSSRNPAVAAVSAQGVVVAKRVGRTQVAASVGGKADVAVVTVAAPPEQPPQQGEDNGGKRGKGGKGGGGNDDSGEGGDDG
jgi:Bacterial Ig-like domain (group 2)